MRAGKGFTLLISNKDMNDIIKIVKSLKDSGVLIDGVTETVKHEIKTRRQISWTFVSTFTQPENNGPQDVPRTSPSNIPRTSLKILFDRPRNVPIWRPGDVPIWHPRDVLKWRLGDVLIQRLWQVDWRRPQDVLRTSPRRPSEYSNLDVPAFFLTFLSELIRLTKSI